MEGLPKFITKEEVINKFKDKKQYSNWIALKLKSKTYKKIRNNLYALIDTSTKDIYSTKFEIASKISNTSFVIIRLWNIMALQIMFLAMFWLAV